MDFLLNQLQHCCPVRPASGLRALRFSENRPRAYGPGDFRRTYAPRDLMLEGFSPNFRALRRPAPLSLQKVGLSGLVVLGRFGFLDSFYLLCFIMSFRAEFVILVILG